MSQRGGDVISTVRYGDQVFSPLPALQETDYILAFEKLEALRNINYLRENGIVLVNDFAWPPLPVAAGFEKYPLDVVEQLRQLAGEVVLIPATRLAGELGNEKASNVILIGLLASRMEIDKKLWLDIIRKKVPPKFIDLNLMAFESGFQFKPEHADRERSASPLGQGEIAMIQNFKQLVQAAKRKRASRPEFPAPRTTAPSCRSSKPKRKPWPISSSAATGRRSASCCAATAAARPILRSWTAPGPRRR